ncbi:zinc-binding dehydrogenase [Actinoplanes utahensis]|uniref:Alcohol dehydrogenase n=1 Tax=Actinoplanes utahensis TaxID=1869 RepID=A0A0A6UTJ5_ACTUT|nr:zinc-binding dehydrogenase [Actinoplanes utahensis]KHD78278.1 alcohol dehydrogenase [Actinoplanes utahensis]GIF28877.1 NADPH:quinone reductase [Actinoplanes utahensis]
MKALVTSAAVSPGIRLESLPDPDPAPGEVLIEVRAVAVNRADLLLAARRPPGSQLGLDVAGVVVRAAPDGTGPPVGTPVAALAASTGWAQLAAVRTDRLAILPEGVEPSVAAAVPVAGLTALYALQRAGWLLARTVLVTGASGGVGGFVADLAAAAGASVLGWVGSPQRGAHLVERGHRLHIGDGPPPGEAVDLLIDSVGGTVLRDAFVTLRAGGVAVVFGNTVRADLVLPPDWGHARPGVRLEHLFLLDEVERRNAADDLSTLLGLVADGRLRPHIGLRADWADAGSAIEALLERRVTGRVVLSL